MTTLRNFQDVELEVKRTNLEVERLLTDVRLILDRINHIRISDVSTVSPSLVTDHGVLTGLGDDDHLQYILVSGARPFTGDQSHGDFNITNVGDISLDSITSDDTTITIGGTSNSIVLTDNTTIAVTLGNDSGDDFTIDATALVVEGDTGGVGLGTSSVPHGGIGVAKLALDGPSASSASGPHIQTTIETDNYPLLQLLSWQHDFINICFDAYWAGSNFSSSDVGSNFVITKQADVFRIRYDSGVALGGTLTLNDGIILNTSGQVGIGMTPTVALEVAGTITGTTVTGANVTSGVDPGHTHTGGSLGGIDISDDTNLAVAAPITLTDDTIGFDINILAVATIAAGDFIPFWDITVTADNKKITFANLEATLNHDSLAEFVANEHVDHSAVTLTAGTGLSGGGTIELDRTFTVDLNELTTETSIAADDFIAMVDITDSGSGKITFANLEAVIDHGNIAGAGDDDHSQYALLAGRATGQTLIGGTASGEDLTLQSTAHATKGSILFGASAYDEVNDRLGVATTLPFQDVAGGTSDFSGDGIHLKGGVTRVVIEGATSVINMISLNGGVDDKILSFAVSGTGTARWLSSNDDLTTRVDNILVMDMGTGSVGVNTAPVAKLDVVRNATAIYADVSPTSTDVTFLMRNTSDGAGIFSGMQFNNSGNSQNRIAYIGAISESAGNRKASLVLGTDNGSTRGEKMRITGDGNAGFGIVNPDGKFHIHTATAGSVTASGSANELVLENSGDCGLSILAPDVSTSAIIFASPSDISGAWVSWNFNSKLFVIGSTTTDGEVRINTGTGALAAYMDSSQNLGIRTSTAFGSGAGVLGIANASTNPSTNPSLGGVLYSDAGAGKWRSSGGTTTTFGPAEPHCEVCGRDFVLEWENKKTGHLIVCMWCLTEELSQNDWIVRRERNARLQ